MRPIDYEEILDADDSAVIHDDDLSEAESSPTVRMANALMVNAFAKGASLIRLEPADGSRIIQYKIDGRWHDEVELPRSLSDDVARRFKLMAAIPPHEPDAALGQFLLRLGEDGPDLQIRVLMRPAANGQRQLVRLVPEAEAACLTWRLHEGTEAAELKLRWDHEHVTRLARSAQPAAAEEATRAFLEVAESLLPGAYRMALEAHMLLAGLAEDEGAVDRAISELGIAIEIAHTLGAPPMSTSVILERLAELLEESGKLDAAIDARLEAADLVETTLGHDDPYIAGVLSRLGDTLASGGRLDEANAAYDEAIRILSDLTGDDDLELRELVAASARIVAPRL